MAEERAERESAYFASMMDEFAKAAKMSDDDVSAICRRARASHEAAAGAKRLDPAEENHGGVFLCDESTRLNRFARPAPTCTNLTPQKLAVSEFAAFDGCHAKVAPANKLYGRDQGLDLS